MLTILLTVLFVLVGSLAQADTSSTHEQQNTKQYGNCGVSTGVDMFTDEEIHVFVCVEETLTDKTQIAIRSDSKSLTILLSKGVQFHLDTHIQVVIRIDKDGLIRRTASWNSSTAHAIISDEQLAHQLLRDLARGHRVAIQVGDEGCLLYTSPSPRDS